jgi:hypothetical protein
MIQVLSYHTLSESLAPSSCATPYIGSTRTDSHRTILQLSTTAKPNLNKKVPKKSLRLECSTEGRFPTKQ